MLTAQIAILLSAKLEAEGSYVNHDHDEDLKTDEQGGVDDMDTETSGGVQLDTSHKTSTIGSAAKSVKIPLLAPLKALTVSSQKSPVVGDSRRQEEDEALDFDSLPTEADTNGSVPLEDLQADMQTAPKTTMSKGQSKVMPSFNSDFWNVYGNNLRVFGTQESVCSLGG